MRGRTGSRQRFRDRDAWDVAGQLASLRKKAGLSQKELSKKVGTSQQQISRLESPSYRGHSLSMLRRVADVLAASVHVEIRGKRKERPPIVVDTIVDYGAKAGIRRDRLQKHYAD